MKKIIMIMVDGFGVPPEGWHNSLYAKYCPVGFIDFMGSCSIPLDASLGKEGLPQSATGQTAIFTGRNTVEIMNGHIPGFPGPTLRKIIREGNLLSDLKKQGVKVTFANAYARHSLKALLKTKFASVTTVMASTVMDEAPGTEAMLAGKAVYHDITRRTIAVPYSVPLITPAEGASHLLDISSGHDFTLFEYFMTDKAGHSQDQHELKKTLSEFSAFIVSLKNNLPVRTVLAICSDHGNCEDITTNMHTRNPVPFVTYNSKTGTSGMESIMDIYGWGMSEMG